MRGASINSTGTLGLEQHPRVLIRGIIWGVASTSIGGIDSSTPDPMAAIDAQENALTTMVSA